MLIREGLARLITDSGGDGRRQGRRRPGLRRRRPRAHGRTCPSSTSGCRPASATRGCAPRSRPAAWSPGRRSSCSASTSSASTRPSSSPTAVAGSATCSRTGSPMSASSWTRCAGSPAAGRRSIRRSSPSSWSRRQADDRLRVLTPREREVLAAMAEGRTNAGISEALGDHRGRDREAHQQHLRQARAARLGACPPTGAGGPGLPRDLRRGGSATVAAAGSRARTTVGPPVGLVTASDPSSASTRPTEPGQSAARDDARSTRRRHPRSRRRAARRPAGSGSRSASAGRAWSGWRPPPRRRSRRPARPRREAARRRAGRSRRRSAPGRDRRAALRAGTRPRSRRMAGAMPRTRSRSSARAWRAWSRASSTRTLADAGVGLDPLRGQTEVDRQHDQSLLGAVVEVSLDAPQLVGLDVDHRLAAGLEGRDPPLQRLLLRFAEQAGDDRAVEGHEPAGRRCGDRRERQADEAARDGDRLGADRPTADRRPAGRRSRYQSGTDRNAIARAHRIVAATNSRMASGKATRT